MNYEYEIFTEKESTRKTRPIKNGLLQLTIGYSGSDIERGTRVALFKTFSTELLTYDIFYKSLKLVGGTAIHVGRQDFLSSAQPEENQGKGSGSDYSVPPEI